MQKEDNMLIKQCFKSHAGKKLNWKIECDLLSDDNVETFAYLISKKFRFKKVVGIPNGGIRLMKALRKYEKDTGDILLVDDVLTTGNSLKEWGKMIKKRKPSDKITCITMFNRGSYTSDNVYSVFTLTL